MRIQFFGSSHGVPEPNRKCSCIFLEAGNRKYLIDLGVDPIQELIDRGYPADCITACFVTHTHGDHLDGILHYVDLLSWYYKTASPAFYLPKPEVMAPLKEYLSWNGATLREDLVFQKIESGNFYRDDVISMTAVPTGHLDVSYAFILEAEGKKVLFSGDMHVNDGPLTDFDRILGEEKFDLAVGECAHFDGTLYEAPLRRNPPKRFVLNHYSSKKLETCLQLKRKMADLLNVELATDGMTLDV